MFSRLVHWILSLSISYPYLIKFHYSADNSQEGVKHQTRGATQVQEGMTLLITQIPLEHFILWFNKNFLTSRVPPEEVLGGERRPKDRAKTVNLHISLLYHNFTISFFLKNFMCRGFLNLRHSNCGSSGCKGFFPVLWCTHKAILHKRNYQKFGAIGTFFSQMSFVSVVLDFFGQKAKIHQK